MEEYKMLRAEINNCISIQNNLSTFSITVVVALLALDFATVRPLFLLLPFAVLIPTQGRIFHYRLNTKKLSAYLIVFLEPHIPIKWETRHRMYATISRQYVVNHFRNFESFFLAIACTVLLIFQTFATGTPLLNALILILISLALSAYVFQVAWRTNRVLQQRDKCIADWEEVLKRETTKLVATEIPQAPSGVPKK